MPVIRRECNDPFTRIRNEPINDERMGTDDLAVLVWLLSKPHDWKVIPAAISTRFTIGRGKTYAILKRLVALGYVDRQDTFAGPLKRGCEYVVRDVPRCDDFRHAENRHVLQKTEPLQKGVHPKGKEPKRVSATHTQAREVMGQSRIIQCRDCDAISYEHIDQPRVLCPHCGAYFDQLNQPKGR